MPHIFYYYRVIVALSYSAAVVTVVCRAMGLPSLQRLRPTITLAIYGAAGLITLWYCAGMQASLRRSLDDHPCIDQLYAAINPRHGTTYELLWGYGGRHHFQWETATALAYQLRKNGFSCCVPDEWLFIFGEEMSCANVKGGMTILSLFNADTPQAEIDALRIRAQRDVVCGNTRLRIWEMPVHTLPLVIRYDAPDAYFRGFCAAGKIHRWTGSDRAGIGFVLGGSPRGDRNYIFQLVLISFEPQEIAVSLNGYPMGRTAVERKLYRLAFRVPPGVLNFNGSNTFQIELPTARRYEGTQREFSGIGFMQLSISRDTTDSVQSAAPAASSPASPGREYNSPPARASYVSGSSGNTK
jgi:hypothetical protein